MRASLARACMSVWVIAAERGLGQAEAGRRERACGELWCRAISSSPGSRPGSTHRRFGWNSTRPRDPPFAPPRISCRQRGRRRGARLWGQHRLRQARAGAHRAGRHRRAAATPRPLAHVRRGRSRWTTPTVRLVLLLKAGEPRSRAAPACATDTIDALLRLLAARRPAGDPGPGLGRRLGRSRTPGPRRRGADRRRPGPARRPRAAGGRGPGRDRPGAAGARPPRKGWRCSTARRSRPRWRSPACSRRSRLFDAALSRAP